MPFDSAVNIMLVKQMDAYSRMHKDHHCQSVVEVFATGNISFTQ
jgi:hypothetical protein